jgi:nucleobase:cation symporter-1, NCS1 family
MTRELLETRAIERIPSDERHGRVGSLLSLWFISNAQVLVITFGIAVIGLGLSLSWAIAAIVIGVLAGTPIMAYHSAQGPKLGVPQMIQSRAQFGLIGGILPTLVAFVLYVAFVVLGSTVLGPATAGVLHISTAWGIVVFNLVCLVITWVGYNLIHSYNRVLSVITIILFIALTLRLALDASGTAMSHASGDTPSNIILGITIAATNQITWSPYVSDYSRYLPENTPVRRAVWLTGIGAAVGGAFSMILGALAGALALNAADANTAGYLADAFHHGGTFLLLLLVLGAVPGQLESIYGAFLTWYTALSPSGRLGNAVALRLIVTTAVAAVGCALAIVAQSHLITVISNASVVALDFLIPWSAINLADFYLLRRGRYDVGAFFNASRYGVVNWPTIVIYLVVVGLEFPFVNTSFFEGPLAKLMGGADISWIVGFVLGLAAYYVVGRMRVSQQPQVPSEVAVEH